jgi:hypothetical protein
MQKKSKRKVKKRELTFDLYISGVCSDCSHFSIDEITYGGGGGM